MESENPTQLPTEGMEIPLVGELPVLDVDNDGLKDDGKATTADVVGDILGI